MGVTEKTVKLSNPVVIAGNEVSELTMRQATVGDLLDAYDMAESEMGKTPSDPRVEAYVVAACCGIPMQELLKMPRADYTNLVLARLFLDRAGRNPEAKELESEKVESGEKP